MRRYSYLYQQNKPGEWEGHFPSFPIVQAVAASESELKRKLDEKISAYFRQLDRQEQRRRNPQDKSGSTPHPLALEEQKRRVRAGKKTPKHRYKHIPKETRQIGWFYIGPEKYTYLYQRREDGTYEGRMVAFPKISPVVATTKKELKGELYSKLEPYVRERGHPEEPIQAERYYLHLDDLYQEPHQRKRGSKTARKDEVEELR